LISYLEGILKSISDEKVTLVVHGVGYEILLPNYVMQEARRILALDGQAGFFISFHQTERQPKPVLVGFNQDVDREFFELFISVEDIGPLAAVKALTKPAREIARSIEDKDIKGLRQLKGIGERKAEKIVATLKGKVAKYALIRDTRHEPEVKEDFRIEVEGVLVAQLGYRSPEARKMVEEALKREPAICSSEELFNEVYRGQKR
jgi:holliday junction DNA helicase RuvA